MRTFSFSTLFCSLIIKVANHGPTRIPSYLSVLTYVLGAQKNRLIEMVLLSTHSIFFG